MAKDKPGYILTKNPKDVVKLAKKWLKISPTERKEFRDKNNLVSLISKARGSIIFGAINDAERSPNNVVVGLDEKGALIFVTGKPAKVYDPVSFLNKIVKKEDFDYSNDADDEDDDEDDDDEDVEENYGKTRLHAKIRVCDEDVTLTDDEVSAIVEDYSLNDLSSPREIIIAYNESRKTEAE